MCLETQVSSVLGPDEQHGLRIARFDDLLGLRTVCVSNTFFTLGQPVGNLMTKATGQPWAYVPTIMAAAVKSFSTEEPSTLVTQTRCAKNDPRDAHENDFPLTGAWTATTAVYRFWLENRKDSS